MAASSEKPSLFELFKVFLPIAMAGFGVYMSARLDPLAASVKDMTTEVKQLHDEVLMLKFGTSRCEAQNGTSSSGSH